MKIRAYRAGQIEAAGQGGSPGRCIGAHPGEADFDAGAAGTFKGATELAQRAVGEAIAVRMRKHRQAAGGTDEPYGQLDARPSCRH